MKKKTLSILLSVLFVLNGCANDPDNSDSSEKRSETSEVSKSGENPEFKGIPLSEKDINEYSTINNKAMTPQLFCGDGDTIYFSNPNDGFTLYSYNGKDAKRLTDIASCCLNYDDGGVYFLLPESTGPLDTWSLSVVGSPYRYDIDSTVATKLSDTAMSNLRVDDSGIFYTKTEDNGESSVYSFDPQSGESEYAYRGFGVQNIGGYTLTNEINGSDSLDTLFVKDGERIRVMSGKMPFYACIHKGIFYYRDAANGSWSFNSIDLASGRTAELEKCNDYTVLGDRLFLIKKGKLYLSEEDGAKPVLVGALTTGNTSAPTEYGYYFEYLYACGGELYAVVSYDRDRCSFAKVELSADADTASVTLIG